MLFQSVSADTPTVPRLTVPTFEDESAAVRWILANVDNLFAVHDGFKMVARLDFNIATVCAKVCRRLANRTTDPLNTIDIDRVCRCATRAGRICGQLRKNRRYVWK